MRFCASGWSFFDLLLPVVGVHQQLDDLRVAPEAPAVGMVRGQEDPPGIVDEQEQLESHRPLHGVDEVALLVHVGNDPAAGLVLHVQIAPLAPGELMEQVLPGTVGGDRHGIAEEDRPRVGRQVRVGC